MQFLRNNWFLAALVGSLFIGYQFADALYFAIEAKWFKWMVVSITMIAMTWPLQTSSLVDAVKHPMPAIIASIINLLCAPLLAWPLSKLLNGDMGAGLILAAAVPSTLASAAVWTRKAGGNDSISMMVTIITNTVCFLVTPAWVFWLIEEEIAGFNISDSIVNLLLFLVIPMGLGQALRMVAGSANWATKNKPTFSLVAQFGVLVMVVLGSIKMAKSLDIESSNLVVNQVLIVVVIVSGLHLVLFFAGIMAGRAIRQDTANQIAIGFSASQKTLMVGLSVAVSMGLNLIPIVAYHALQLIIDTLIADRYLRKNQSDALEE